MPSAVVVHANTTRIPLAGETFSRREQELDPATNVWTVYFDPENTLPAGASDGLILNFYGWDPPTEPSVVAQAFVRRAGDSQIIFKFQAPDEVTHKPAFFIISKAMHLDRGYGYLNISKITSVGSAAYAVTFDRRFPGKDAAAIDQAIKQWLLTPEAHTVQNALGTLSMDTDWEPAARKPHQP